MDKMSKDEFFKRMMDFVQSINEKNSKKTEDDDEFIILDKNYFDLKDNMYTVSPDFYDVVCKSKILFVGDNPGEFEKKYREYLYCSDDQDWMRINHRRAGVKANQLFEAIGLSRKDVIIFNKCLLSTKKTSDLSPSAIKYTCDEVIDFIRIVRECNPEIIVIFSGIEGVKDGNSKFKRIHDIFVEHPNVYLAKHVTRGMLTFKNYRCDFSINREKNLYQFIEYLECIKRHLIKENITKDEDNDDPNSDPDSDPDSNPDSDPSPTPIPV